MNKTILIVLILVITLVLTPVILFHTAMLAVKIVFVLIVIGVIAAILEISTNKKI